MSTTARQMSTVGREILDCRSCRKCTKAERIEWYDYLENSWRNEWMYLCDLDNCWMTTEQALQGDCPSYEQDMDNDFEPQS